MKYSYNWLQSFFDEKLPKPEKLAEILTMHSFEVENIHEVRLQKSPKSDFVLEADILPNRAHDLLCHFGAAKEIGALLNLKIKVNVTKVKPLLRQRFNLCVEETNLCRRYVGRIVEGVKVGPSPKWLKERLEVVGQKSVNNIVDATNYVMLEMNQPLHVFDLDKVKDGIAVRKAKKGEKITTLENQEFELDENVLVIADNDSPAGEPLAIAGIKGGKKAEITGVTQNIILETANFEPVNIRKISRKLNLRTESSIRFENEITTELAGKAIDRLTALILEIAGGKAGAIQDFYPKKPNPYKTGLHPRDTEKLLGGEISEKEQIEILQRLGFEIKIVNPVKKVLELVKTLQGKPYKYGASVTFDAPDAFDCSSLVAYVFAQAGVQVPRITIDQFFYGKPVEEKNIQPVDVIFLNTGEGKIHKETKEFLKGTKMKEGIDHCGIYLGNGKIIHASRYNSDGVMIEDLKKSKQFKNIIGIRRMVTHQDDLMVVTVPVERLDIRIPEDLIEEIGRVYGYEKIKPKLPSGMLVSPEMNEVYFYADKTKDILVGLGFSEIYNYSFADKGAVEVLNPIASDKKFLRTNLLEELGKTAKENSKYFKNVKIFELGKIFINQGYEFLSLAGVVANGEFYQVKGVLDTLFKELGITDFYYEESGERVANIRIGNTDIGIADHNGFELNFEELAKLVVEEKEYRPISKYPAITRDLALFAPMNEKVINILDIIENTAGELLVDTDLFDIYEQQAEDRKSLAFHLVFQSYEKTLTDAEINALMEKIFTAMEANPNWEVRK